MGEYQRQIKQLLGLSLASREEIRRESLQGLGVWPAIRKTKSAYLFLIMISVQVRLRAFNQRFRKTKRLIYQGRLTSPMYLNIKTN